MTMETFAVALTTRKKVSLFKPYNTPREMLSSVTSDFEGRMVKSSAYVLDKPLERFKGLKPTDFCLENLQELGVPMSLCKCSFQTNVLDYELCNYFSNNKKPLNNEK